MRESFSLPESVFLFSYLILQHSSDRLWIEPLGKVWSLQAETHPWQVVTKVTFITSATRVTFLYAVRDERYFFLRTQNIRSCGWLAVSSISTIDLSHLTGALVGIIERLFSSYQPNANIFGLNIICFASLTLPGSHPLIFTQCGLACVHPLRRQFISHILLIMGGTPFSFATTLGSVSTKVFYSLQVVVKWEHSVYAHRCVYWSNYFVSCFS